MNVILEFKSPFIVGGHKRANNFIESIDYIPGSVMRAAFAKFIVYNCPLSENFYDELAKRYYWVRYRGEKECENCKYSNICKNFEKIRFSFFYPQGSKPNPFSNMLCKNYEEHGFQDVLLPPENKEGEKTIGCPKCPPGNNRLEKYTGLIKDGKPYKVTRKTYTRTAINYSTRAVLYGSLFSLVAVAKTDDRGLYYEGKIEGITKEDLDCISEIRIGKYTSVGFGIARLLVSDDKKEENREKTLKKLRDFSDRYKQGKDRDANGSFLALYFRSNVLFKADSVTNKYMETEEYAQVLKRSLKIPNEFEIEEIFSQFGIYRGFDTSYEKPQRKETFLTAPAGTVLVLKSSLEPEKIYEILSQVNGFGEKCQDGYGEFEFYFGGMV